MQRTYRNRVLSFTIFAALACAANALAQDGYMQHNLVSDLPGMADHTDANLVNAWGLTHPPTGPWWVNANGTGLSSLFDGTGAAFPVAQPLVVTIPGPAAGASSAPTGIAFNATTDFQITPNNAARFLFATEDGTIAGWNPAANPTNAVIKVNNSPSAVYKGIALGQINFQNVLFVANFRSGAVEAYDPNFNFINLQPGAFVDSEVPPGFAPFNVQNVNGDLFVTFAKQDAAKHDDVAGPGLGYVDEFTPEGALVRRFEHGRWLDSPWGVTTAPADFGKLSGRVLVGNFGSGQIASFSPSGEFQGMMRGRRGKPITIDGLWGLGFGNNATAGPANVLFFTAGIQDEAHGLFGTLTPIPKGPAGKNDTDNGGQ
jgi:uncharacterized protein (TIGR03118 family)